MRLHRANERRGIILMVVLSLLTLFAIVGVTFVLYADSEATSARVARDAETAQRADMDPERALALFLGQFIYDVNDTVTGVGSGLRGHSLARTMYGYNSAAANILPFSGVGRLHYQSQFTLDDYTLINYTWFSGDNFVRDPEHYGTRANPGAPQGFFVGGNAPYTYPDLNSFFLAAVTANGTVLAPSFHRDYTGFGSLAPTNPNWTAADPKLKYLVLRPRPAEHPGFPLPEDAGGDVKNLPWAPGGNDSIWIDIGLPVMTAPDGTPYKMLVAPLIIDLDGRINLGTAGNILGPGDSHVSNQGFGGWEVNLAKVLYADSVTAPVEYKNLILGKTAGLVNPVRGKYMQNPNPPVATPSWPGSTITSGTPAHFYAQGDVNGWNETATYSTRPLPPGVVPNNGLTPPPLFPLFQQGYLNGGGVEPTNHPLLYNLFRPSTAYPITPPYITTRVFRPGDMEALLRPNSNTGQPVDSGSSTLVTDLIRLCPTNFGPSAASTKFRNLVTTLSMDVGGSGVSPYWWNGMPAGSYLAPNLTNTMLAPLGAAAPFPAMPPSAAVTTSGGPSEFGPDWRAASANPTSYAANNTFLYMSPGGRIRLNRPLPPYPHMGAGATPPYSNQPPNNPSPYGVAYDLTKPPIAAQYTAAVTARQALANDIYRRLLAITGVAPVAPANLATPLYTDLAPRRWLAQLAVNIVDFIDEDDISTPFNFYNTQDTNGAAVNTGATQGADDPQATGANPLYWVFGTELPKVVVNEALAEAQDPDPTKANTITDESVKVWIELFNTMQAPAASANTQPQDAFRVPLYVTNPAGGGYSPYRISIAQTPMHQPPPTFTIANPPQAGAPLPDAGANELGKAFVAPPFPQSTTDADFAGVVPLIGGGNQAAFTVPVSGNVINAGVDAGSFFLIGPPDPGNKYEDPFVAAAGMNPGVPANTPTLRKPSMMYPPAWGAASTTDERTTGLTVMLRRLANPYLPFQPNPGVANYNPYVTVDYLQNVPIQSNKTLPAQYNSRGKTQPYAALTKVPVVAGVPQALAGSDAMAGSPVLNQQVNPNPPPTAIVVPAGQITHSFGMTNFPLPPSGHYTWLVQLDRQPISPMELLHVSGYQPHQLTQRFMLGLDAPLPANSINLFGHYVPWLDVPPAPIASLSNPWWFDANLPAGSSHRLYRLFEFFESGDWATGVNGLGRIPGKVNINTIWDREILQALLDANPSLGLPANPPGNPFDPTKDVVDAIFANLIASRSPTGKPGLTGVVNATDHPFLPLSVGFNPGGTVQFPTLGTSVSTDTILRMSTANPQLLLFQNPGAAAAMPPIPPDTSAGHPYLQTQLLTKLYNNVTTRSNTFAVFLTVGFFQVTGTVAGSANVPQLGAEIGRSEGRQVRHRMFAIVDRTNLAAFSTTSSTPVAGPTVPTLANPALPNNPFGNATIVLTAPGAIGIGTQLVIEPGTANEETVIVQAVTGNQVTANFLKQHPNSAVTGNPSPTYSVIIRGNPGPRTTPYDPRQDPLVVPYFSIID